MSSRENMYKWEGYSDLHHSFIGIPIVNYDVKQR